MNTMSAVTLIVENQNSATPNDLTLMRFTPRTTAATASTAASSGTPGHQKRM